MDFYSFILHTNKTNVRYPPISASITVVGRKMTCGGLMNEQIISTMYAACLFKMGEHSITPNGEGRSLSLLVSSLVQTAICRENHVPSMLLRVTAHRADCDSC